MKKIITIIFLLLPLLTYSQDSDTTVRHWTISMTFSPDFYFSKGVLQLSEYTGYNMQPEYFNYSTGITVTYKINSKFLLGTSLTYSNKDMQGKYYCQTCYFVEEPEPEKIKFRFAGFPIFVQYYFIQKNPAMYFTSGLTTEYRVMSIQTIYSNNPSITTILFSPLAGLGVNYSFGKNKRISISSEINYKQSVSDLTNSNYKLKKIGLTTTIGYKL